MNPALARVDRESAPCPLCGGSELLPVERSRAQMAEVDERFDFCACGGCGLVRLEPRVPVAEIASWYDSTYLPHRGGSAWGKWSKIVDDAQAGTDRARVRRVRSTGPLGPGTRLVDVGCGLPTFLEAAASTGAACTGLDFAADLWARDPGRWKGIELVHGTVEQLGDRAGFDAITLWHALEHEYQPVQTLAALRERAAPGARLVVEVPDHDSLTRRLHGSDWAGYHTPRHTMAFTADSLKKVVEAAGWRVARQDRWGTLDPYVLWWLGEQERTGRSVRGSLEARFVPFVLGKILSYPVVALERWLPLGVQTLVALRD